jgi:hypothetical protein
MRNPHRGWYYIPTSMSRIAAGAAAFFAFSQHCSDRRGSRGPSASTLGLLMLALAECLRRGTVVLASTDRHSW